MLRYRTAAILLVAICLNVACASTGGVPRPFPIPDDLKEPWPPSREPLPGSAPANSPAGSNPDGDAIVGTALSLRGVPYRDGGNDVSGFDCSGFVWFVFARHGVTVPRSVTAQFREGTSVSRDALRAGDLVFFSTTGRGVSHVGVAVGRDEFVHAPSSRGEVRVERLGSAYWAARFIGARRMH
jgi:cell wall-associated NlpC family hydrolase